MSRMGIGRAGLGRTAGRAAPQTLFHTKSRAGGTLAKSIHASRPRPAVKKPGMLSRGFGAMAKHPGRTAMGVAGGFGVAGLVTRSGNATDKTGYRESRGSYMY